MSIPRIVRGLEFVDDDGDDVIVRGVSESRGIATLEGSDGESYSMSLRELRRKFRDGEFVCLADDDHEDEGDDDEDEDEDDDEQDEE